jgi:hypothetical protein
VKYLARAILAEDGSLQATVEPTALLATDPLASPNGSGNAIRVEGGCDVQRLAPLRDRLLSLISVPIHLIGSRQGRLRRNAAELEDRFLDLLVRAPVFRGGIQPLLPLDKRL